MSDKLQAAPDAMKPNAEVKHTFSDPVKPERGAQNHLTGAARAAARGGLHGDITSNTIARDAAVARGEAADGSTPDGSTPDGRMQPDVVDGADQAQFSEPAKGTPAPTPPPKAVAPPPPPPAPPAPKPAG